MTDDDRTTTTDAQTFELEPEQELRVECANDGARVTLVDGTAECFGAEIARGQTISCKPGKKMAIFTYHGARVEVQGKVEIAYVAGETPMVSYANTHSVLHAKRDAAKAAGAEGPRVMCVGPTDVGKSTVCSILCNYATRAGYSPLYVDLDLGQGAITVPGTIGAAPIESQIDLEEGIPLEMPLVYYYGDLTVNNPDYYKNIVTRLGNMLDQRSKANDEARAAGCVVNTMGWVDGLGLELLLHAREALNIDHVLVIGQERLFGQLQQKLAGTECQVFRLQKSGGVVERTPEYRRASRDRMFKEYFYGPTGEFAPASQTAYFSSISLYRIGGGPRAPSSALPIGQQPSTDPMRVAPVVPSTSLLHSVLAVSHGKTQGELLSSNVAGFIYITEVDMVAKKFTYLSPCPGDLPSSVFLVGNLKWLAEGI
jgi:polyribonucleotide 5'-hydroxyl-kinase|uniref:Protein CLP1 homolog n=1 Tax=Ostreococcus mediterraneus TaxID=1486918 RepID=A0A7S0KGS7_9CHLO|mmetsp:Transcript_4420/g.16188  ORF Transcript_4420/g.16188 Transcript_4420/m.16188 type:complete len:426 (+) Transcript_4420:40-1317(+)